MAFSKICCARLSGTHPEIAERLDLTVPVQGEWISVRLAVVDKVDERPKVWLEDRWWAVARSEELQMPAPVVPRGELPAQPQ
ncbi:NaeI family type II restriction endonuclease [Lentzea sp. NPDC058450]|uniref:NaeI family type II restriction endonuclease n=1 Tax=Lentzea sp. NPDC058450 TaxID=3346505 RepID=UPI0036592768